MATYYCPECETEMNLLWEENKVICPNCGCWEEISDEVTNWKRWNLHRSR